MPATTVMNGAGHSGDLPEPQKTVSYLGGPPTAGDGPPSRWAEAPQAGPGPGLRDAIRAGGYEVLGELGRGGMGIVYLAHNLALNRPCALKTFPAEVGGPTAVARLRAEAEAVARVRHPNVVQIYSVGEVAGIPFLELEYLPGGSLADSIAGGPRPVAEAARLIEPVARAVGQAHRLGIVHRDLKPANILLTAGGEPKVGDFGLARSLGSDVRLTLTGQIVGTPSYMAPEQVDPGAGDVGPAADIHSLGVILYELLTGHCPFRGPTALHTLDLVRSREPLPPRRIQPAVPHDLETICLKCLHKDPARRYPGAEALADDLGRFLHGHPILARPTGTVERAWKWTRRHPAVAALSVAWIVTTALALLLVSWQWRRAEDKAAAETRAHAEARRARLQAVRGQSELAMEHGRAFCERGEIGQGMLWLARSLRLAAEARDEELGRAVRINLADWSARLGRPLARLQLGAPARDLAFRADGRVLVSLGDDGSLHRWDTDTWHEAAPPCAARARDEGRAARWDPERGRIVAQGWRLLVAPRDGPVRVWDVASLRVSALPPEGAAVTSLAVSPGGDRFATGTEGGTVRLWDSTTLRQGGPTIRLDGTVRCLAFRPDGGAVAVALEDGTIPIWEVPRTGPIAPPLSARGSVRALAFDEDGTHLLAVGGRGPVQWDIGPRGAPTRRVPDVRPGDAAGMSDGPTGPFGIAAVSPDRQLIAVTTASGPGPGGLAGSRILLLGAATRALVGEGPGGPHALAGAAFSPDSRLLFTWGPGPGTASLREVDAMDRARPRCRSLGVAIAHAAFHPDGTTLLLGCRDGTARLWDVARDVAVPSRLRPRHAYPITAVAFDPRGPRVVTGCHAGTVRLWDRASGALLHDIRGNAGEVTAVAFSPDGTTLVTASLDASARFWDVASGRQLGPPLYHTDAVLSVAFHPDGRFIATGARDASAWLWPIPAAPMEGDLARIDRVVEERTGLGRATR
jgi:WD40 repeat protein